MSWEERNHREWERKVANTTRYKTVEEFDQALLTASLVGFEDDQTKYVQHIYSEEEFLEFCQRVYLGNDGLGSYYSKFLYDSRFEKYVRAKAAQIQEDFDELDIEDFELEPTVVAEGYALDINEFMDEIYGLEKVAYRKYSTEVIEVIPGSLPEFPFIASFFDIDSFDRCGSVKGGSLELTSLKPNPLDRVISIR